MGRKERYSKELKIQACEEYIAGKGSFNSIAKNIGCDAKTVRKWYLTYINHGLKAFETSDRNNSYSKEFKLSIVKEYMEDNTSMLDLSAKYKICEKVIRNWIKKYYNGIELKDYDPKGEIYKMKSRKVPFEERVEIVKWVIENNMNYKEAAVKFATNYANVYKWTKAYIMHGKEALKDKRRGPRKKKDVDLNKLSEVERLKIELEKERELRKYREFQIEVLKKKEEYENRYRK
jgi:transposase-like protein